MVSAQIFIEGGGDGQLPYGSICRIVIAGRARKVRGTIRRFSWW